MAVGLLPRDGLTVELKWGAGPVTKERLAEISVETIGQLANTHAWSRSEIWPKSPIRRDGRLLPMTSPTPPITAAAKQQHQNDDDEDQFHKKSPWLS
jgi:nucleotidyltransferase/DNA polymerase involved in DNA repair